MRNNPNITINLKTIKFATFVVPFILLMFSISAFAQNVDIDILKEINLNRNKSLDPSFRFITNSVTPISIAVPCGFIACALTTKDSISRVNAILISSSLALSGVLATSLKYGIGRQRPYITYPIIEKVTSEGTPSFPSGHTSFAFSTATSLSIAYPKWYVIAPSFIWAGCVGYSRMDLGVHYPSDVLAGAIIGSASAYLSYKLNKWYYKKIFR